ncbi:hypothetical protein BH11VER1_BH11VER1_11840 [soil metagenome]
MAASSVPPLPQMSSKMTMNRIIGPLLVLILNEHWDFTPLFRQEDRIKSQHPNRNKFGITLLR